MTTEVAAPEWTFRHGRGRGTLWTTVHAPTFWELDFLDSSKRHAELNPRNPNIYRVLLAEAWRELGWPEDGIPSRTGVVVTNHDRARGLLTWLAEHHPDLFCEST